MLSLKQKIKIMTRRMGQILKKRLNRLFKKFWSLFSLGRKGTRLKYFYFRMSGNEHSLKLAMNRCHQKKQTIIFIL